MTGYKHTSGGNIEVTWSVAPGQRVHKIVPVEAFNDGTVATLTEEIKNGSRQ